MVLPMDHYAIEVTGLAGPDTEREVTAALVALPGVQWATAAHESGTVGLGVEPDRLDEQALADALTTTGCALASVEGQRS